MSYEVGININATSTGLDQALSQVDALASSMSGVGAGSETISQAMARATAAVASTASALADGKSRYAELEKAANSAAKQVEEAALAGKDTGALEAQAQQAASALLAQAEALDVLKSAADGAKKELKQVKDAQEQFAKASGSGKLNELGEGFGKLGGPVGMIGQKLTGVGESFKKLKGAAGGANGEILAIAGLSATAAVAIAAVAAAAVAATAAIAAWAVGLADASRESRLTYEALAIVDPALAGLSGAAKDVGAATGMGADKIQDFAKQLSAAGVAAEDMPAALMAAAKAETALAGQGAKVVESLKGGANAVGDVAAEVDKKFGGLVSKKMLGLDKQAAKMKANIGNLFGGLNIEGLLVSMAGLIGLFDESSASGQVIRNVFEGVFQPIIDGAAAAGPFIEAFILGVMIGFMKIAVAVKPAISAVTAFAASLGLGAGNIDWIGSIGTAAQYLAPVILVVVAAFGLLALGVAGAIAMALAVPAAIAGIVVAIGAALMALPELGAKMAVIGVDMMSGLANGISSSASAVLSAITGVVNGAIDGAKSLLGIKSPSKVFAEIGDNTAEGFAVGVEANPAPTSALETMVSPPVGGEGGTTNNKNTSNASAVINIYASGDAQSIAEAVRTALRDIMSTDIVVMGAA